MPSLHGGKFKQAGLDISTREKLLRGSDEHKDVVVPGDAVASLLVKKIRHEHEPGMPYQSDRLPDEAIAKIEAWINSQAPYAQALEMPADAPQQAFSHGSDHWAYQRPVKAPVPKVSNQEWVRNSIDAFLAAEHEKRGLKPLPEAGRRTLVRRLYLGSSIQQHLYGLSMTLPRCTHQYGYAILMLGVYISARI